MRKTLYQVLGVTPDAPIEVIEAAWKVLAVRYHPDNQKTGDPEMATKVNSAHDVLKDPKKRKAYDLDLGLNGPHTANGFRPPNTSGVNPGAYPDAYVGLGQDLQPVVQEFGERVTEMVFERMFSNIPPELAEIVKRAAKKAGRK